MYEPRAYSKEQNCASSVRTESRSRAKHRARFSCGDRALRRPRPQIRLVLVVTPAPQLQIARGCLSSVCVRHDVMKFQEARFGAATQFALKRAAGDRSPRTLLESSASSSVSARSRITAGSPLGIV